jgi:hypothetical protein
MEKGAVLVSLHLMESPLLNNLSTRYEVKGKHLGEKVFYDEKDNRVYINKTQYFDGEPPEIWNFHVGGYQVCEKWLKDRKGCKLTIEDIDHYQKIVVALKETICLMSEIDAAIAEHDGWPGRLSKQPCCKPTQTNQVIVFENPSVCQRCKSWKDCVSLRQQPGKTPKEHNPMSGF